MELEEWTTRMDTGVCEQPFPDSEFRSRLSDVQEAMSETELDALLVTTPENMFYLTGYETTGYFVYQALVVPREGRPQFVVRQIESPNVENRAWTTDRREYTDTDDPIAVTRDLLAEMGLKGETIGYEEDSWFLTDRQLRALRRACSAEFVGASGIVEEQRLVKSDRELEYIREAGAMIEQATARGIDAVAEGRSENVVAAETISGLLINGSEHPTSWPYVTSGPRSALPHSRWRDRTLSDGELVFFESAACVRRYHAAQVRTVFLGDPPAVVSEVADAVERGLEAAIDTIEAGVPAGKVDRACRSVIAEAGYADQYPHKLGYSLGLSFAPGWGEDHIMMLRPGSERPLEPNMVFHMPPIVFLPGVGAIGASATVRVTKGGCEVIADLDGRFHTV